MNKRKNVIIMCINALLQGLVFYAPVATIYRQHRGLSMYQIFILESLFCVCMLIFEIPWGYFGDRFGYKQTLVTSYFFLLISKIVFYRAHSFFLFSMEAVTCSLAFSGISGCDSALIYLSVDKENSQKVFGIYSSSGTVGFLLASIISTVLISKSVDLTVLATIFPYALVFILSLFLDEVKVTKDHKENIGIRESFKIIKNSKTILLFVIGAGLISEATHSISVFLSQTQYINSGIPIKYFGLISVAISAAGLITTKVHKITQKFGEKNVILILYLSMFVSSVLLGVTKIAFLSVLLIGIVDVGFALSQPIAMEIENKSITSANRATILSVYAMMNDVIACVINLFIGKAADKSIQLAFIFCGIIIVSAFFISIQFFKKREKYVKEKFI